MMYNSFERSNYDPCVYFKGISRDHTVYLLLYVDIMQTACKDMNEIGKLKTLLKNEFAMKDLGPGKRILGIDIVRDIIKKLMCICQEEYLKKVINKFNMVGSKAVINHWKNILNCLLTNF